MQHLIIERWSRGDSPLHQRDPRVKIVVLLAYLIAIAFVRPFNSTAFAVFGLLVFCAILIAKLPLHALLLRAAGVLPFSAVFAFVSYIAGDADRAVSLLGKSLSAAAVLVTVGSTPIPELMRGAERLGTPAILALVIQFLYRYLFVVTGQAYSMWAAAQCRGLSHSRATRGERFSTAAGSLAVLFGRSYAKAEGIDRAMLARGFNGSFPTFRLRPFAAADLLLAVTGIVLIGAAYSLTRVR